MARPCLMAVLMAILLCLVPATAHARSQTLTVGILDSATNQPAVGAKVDIVDMQGNSLGSGVVGPAGNVTITFELPDGVDKLLISADARSAQGRAAFWVMYVRDARPTGMGVAMSTDTYWASGSELMDLAKAAVAK